MSIYEKFQSLSTEFIVVQILLILAVLMAVIYLNSKKTAYGVAGAISAAVALFFMMPMEVYACVVAFGVVALCFIVRLSEDRNAQQSETTQALLNLRKSLDDVNKTLTRLANKDRNITITAPSGFVYAQEMPPLAKQPQQYKAAAASAPAEPASVILKGKPEPELKAAVPEPIETPADAPAIEQELLTEASAALEPAPVGAPADLQAPTEEASAPEQTTASEQTETPVAPIQTEMYAATPAAPERTETPAVAPAVPKQTEPPAAWQPQPVPASQPPKEAPQQQRASAYPPSPQPVARPQPARPSSVFRDEEAARSRPVFRKDVPKEEIVYRSENKLAAFFKKRSVLLLIAFLLGIAALVGYRAIISGWIGEANESINAANSTDDISESIGNATEGVLNGLAAVALTFPFYVAFVGTFFALLGWLLNQRWAALLAGIAFGIAMLIGLTRFYIPVLPMAFCIAAYSKMKKAKT